MPKQANNIEDDKSLDLIVGEIRGMNSKTLKRLKYDANPAAKPPVIQELMLAQRHMEDAESRLDRALALIAKQPKQEDAENAA